MDPRIWIGLALIGIVAATVLLYPRPPDPAPVLVAEPEQAPRPLPLAPKK